MRTHPEKSRQIHARALGALRVQVIAQVHQRRGLAGGRCRRQRLEGDREAAARAPGGKLDEAVPADEKLEKRSVLPPAGRGQLARPRELRTEARKQCAVRLPREALPREQLLESESL